VRRLVLATLATLLLASGTFAQNLPPGKWWRRPEVVSSLSLSEDQQVRLDGIFAAAANDLIDARGEADKAEIALHSELEQPQINRENIRKVVTRLNEARSRKFAREVMMLVDMRAVLTDQQWTQLRSQLDRMKGRANQQDSPLQRPRNRR
jgi:Spy/CpxP family protein refolding chaperone